MQASRATSRAGHPKAGEVYRLGGAAAEVQAVGAHWVVATIDGIDRELAIADWRRVGPALLARSPPSARPPPRSLRPGAAFVSRSAGSIRILAAGARLCLVEWAYGGRRQRQIFTRIELGAILRRSGRDRFLRLRVLYQRDHAADSRTTARGGL